MGAALRAPGGRSMRYTLKMPKVGDAVDKVVVVDVLAKVGERIAVGQALFLVETDKANVEIPSPFAGTVTDILVAVGEEVATGMPTLAIEA
jgi:pyruvate/2-oxoglutarate dehydrogenase complex dihydrolipoamide acyltransferase (E2) component